MKVVLMNSDYHVELTESDFKKATKRHNSLSLSSFEPIFKRVVDENRKHIKGKMGGLAILCTNESDVLHGENARGGILFEIDERGPIARVYAPELAKLMNGEIDYITSRYDGTNKIWIQRCA